MGLESKPDAVTAAKMAQLALAGRSNIERSGIHRGHLLMAKYNYGKRFKKGSKWVRYRYTGRRKSTKKLVSAPKRRR